MWINNRKFWFYSGLFNLSLIFLLIYKNLEFSIILVSLMLVQSNLIKFSLNINLFLL